LNYVISFCRLLNSHREILPDVPAVYFVSPTDENIKIICDDLNKGMYDSYYLNMISPLSRPRLEQLASAAVCGGTVQHVQKLMDQFLNFISLEDDLFVLRRYNDNSPFSFYGTYSLFTISIILGVLFYLGHAFFICFSLFLCITIQVSAGFLFFVNIST
ncbi:hypothetical protein LOAG_16026, partial [Loa loa]